MCIKKFFKVRRLRKRAELIVLRLGQPIGNGGLYSDDKIRITSSKHRADISIYGEEDRSNIVFLYYEGAKDQHCTEGEWEKYFDAIYKKAKTRP